MPLRPEFEHLASLSVGISLLYSIDPRDLGQGVKQAEGFKELDGEVEMFAKFEINADSSLTAQELVVLNDISQA